MKRKMARCLDCLRHDTTMRGCESGSKPVWFNTDRIAKARRYCDAFYPKCAWVETGNVLVHTAPMPMFDGQEWVELPRRVPSPWCVH